MFAFDTEVVAVKPVGQSWEKCVSFPWRNLKSDIPHPLCIPLSTRWVNLFLLMIFLRATTDNICWCLVYVLQHAADNETALDICVATPTTAFFSSSLQSVRFLKSLVTNIKTVVDDYTVVISN